MARARIAPVPDGLQACAPNVVPVPVHQGLAVGTGRVPIVLRVGSA